MPAVIRRATVGVALTLAAVTLLLAGPGVAFADGRGGHGSESAAFDPKGTASAAVGVQYDKSKNGHGTGAGPLTPVGNWTPPACWYEPRWTAQQAKATIFDLTTTPSHMGTEQLNHSFKDHYINGRPYTDFNMSQQDKGYWWGARMDPSRYSDPAAGFCTDGPFWVDKGQSAPADHKNAVTPEILAELAYAQILIPQGTASMNPAGTQTVNLPTWVWLDGAKFHPVSVTAYLPDYGITATTTATPVSMHIDPGTPDATVYPAGGDCPKNADGSVGTKYSGNATATPPCGVTYLHSTNSTGPYQLKATVTWHVSWTGTGQTSPKDLAAGTFGTPQDVTVQEIQAINR